MKLPFYTIFGPSIRRNYRTLKTVCSYRFLNTSVLYAGFLGFIGLILSLFDVIRIIKAGPVLPCVMWRPRIRTGSVVSPECERDFRLMSLAFSLEYYFLLIIGTATKNAVLYLPWLILYAFIIILEFIVFIARLFMDDFCFSKHSVVLSIFIVYNWLNVFCAFFRLVGGCDY